MKKLLTIAVMTAGITTYAQIYNAKAVSVTAEVLESQGDNFNVRSRDMKIDKDNKTVEYLRDVSFITKEITIDNADKILYDYNTKEITATGNFRVKGVTVEFRTAGRPTTLKYKIGDNIAYVE